MLQHNQHIKFFKSGIATLLVVFLFCLNNQSTYAQSNDNYDEIVVSLNVQKIGLTEIPIVINNKLAYLPVKEIFDFLKIKANLSLELDHIEGFFISPDNNYTIDKYKNTIQLKDKIIQLDPSDLIKTETSIYLKLEYFSSVFGLDCDFNFRSLSVNMSTKIELPAIKEIQQITFRQNLNRIQGEKKVDTTIKRSFPLFQLGMADWAVFSNQNAGSSTNVRVNFGLGAVILGGETNVYLNANSNVPIRAQEQFYRWRLVNNDFTPLRQLSLGTIFTQSASTLYAPINGIQITNTPSTFRRSFGSYIISDKTEPDWTVELYVNNVLVNYTKADASGFFSFDVPLVYGNSDVKLKYYGPWGEVRTSEQQILIPFNFLPKNQYEYTITSGIVQDDEQSKFTRAAINYGLNKTITFGGGVEYLSTVNKGKPMPFVNASIRLGSNLLFNGEHVKDVISRGILTYTLPSNVRIELNYAKYDKNQTAIRSGKNSSNNFLEERKLVAIFPIRTKTFSLFSRLTINQLVLPTSTFNASELMLSGIISNLSVNLTTNMTFSDPSEKIINSNLSITTRLPKGIRLTPLVQYDYIQKNFLRVRTEVEKNIGNRGFVNFTFERDLLRQANFYSLGFRYNFSFAQFSFFGRRANETTTITQAMNGSLLYNQKTKSFITSNLNNVGRGGFIIQPFLDVNGNGIKDEGEQKYYDLGVKINGGRMQLNLKDSSYSVVGLEAYNAYYIDLDKDGFYNIAWRILKPSIKVTVEPNHLKLIHVPISIMGEISGKVWLKNHEGNKGIGRILINIFDNDGNFINKVLSEADGYFSYLGLKPGEYYADLDEAQLLKLKFKNTTEKMYFKIKPSKDGDIVDGVKFQIEAIENSKNE
ncbi:MAG: hypothetical protein KGZ59_06740 [Chitinophagaceae bacterium]|nr:hypothetical protein [Chitinophagaceae bacterium]